MRQSQDNMNLNPKRIGECGTCVRGQTCPRPGCRVRRPELGCRDWTNDPEEVRMGEGTYLACDFATYRVVVNGRHGTRVRSPRELVTAATRTQLRRFWRGLGEPPVADGSMITMANAIFNWAMEAHKPKREEGQVAKAKKKSAKKAGKVKAKKVAPKKEKKERKGRAHNFTRPKNFKDKLEKLTPQGKLCFAAVMAGRKEGETFELSKDEVMAKLKAENIKTTGDLWRNFCWHKSDARGKKLGFC